MSSSVVISCPKCNKQLVLPDECVGRMVGCAYCHHQFRGDEGLVAVDVPCAAAGVPAVIDLANEIMKELHDATEAGSPPNMDVLERLATEDRDIAFECGEIYYYGKDYNCGHGYINSDYVKARAFYEQALVLGNFKAAEMLYQIGLEPSSNPTPWTDMVRWAREGANLGSRTCAMHLGWLASRGISGVIDKNLLQALDWFVKAYHLSVDESERQGVVDEAKRVTGQNLIDFIN